MAKSKSRQARRAAPYLRRAIEDEYVQQQLRNAVTRMREAYGRVSRKQAAAAEDKKLYRNLREAAVSVRNAIGRIEEPPPPKHGLRNTLLAGATIAGAFLLIKSRRGGDDGALAQSGETGWGTGEADGRAAPEPAAAPAG